MITDEEIDKLWDEVMDHPEHHSILDFARQLEQRAREEEREACAKVCNNIADQWHRQQLPDYREVARDCAKLIRARGKS